MFIGKDTSFIKIMLVCGIMYSDYSTSRLFTANDLTAARKMTKSNPFAQISTSFNNHPTVSSTGEKSNATKEKQQHTF